MKNETIDKPFNRFRSKVEDETGLLSDRYVTEQELHRIWELAVNEYREFIKEHPEELDR